MKELNKAIELKRNLDKHLKNNKDIIGEQIEKQIRAMVRGMKNISFSCGMDLYEFYLYKKENGVCVEYDYFIEDMVNSIPEELMEYEKQIKSIIELIEFAKENDLYLYFNTLHPPCYKYLYPRFKNDVNNECYKHSFCAMVNVGGLGDILTSISKITGFDDDVSYVLHNHLKDDCSGHSKYEDLLSNIYYKCVEFGVANGDPINVYSVESVIDSENKKIKEVVNTMKLSIEGAVNFIKFLKQDNIKVAASYITNNCNKREFYINNKDKFFNDVMKRLQKTSIKNITELKSLEYKAPKLRITNNKNGESIVIDVLGIVKKLKGEKK